MEWVRYTTGQKSTTTDHFSHFGLRGKVVIDQEPAQLPDPKQPLPPDPCPVADALARLSQSKPEFRGAVFTRREVVEFILDLVGYTVDRPLWNFALLEPSCGARDFILPVIERLLACRAQQRHPVPAQDLAPCIRYVELHRATCEATRSRVCRALRAAGISKVDAAALAKRWLVQGDFLLTDIPPAYDFVVGNPPYVRQEMIPAALIFEYRARYETIFDRADLYVPFIERSVKLLSAEGKLGIICADRWLKNRYGGPLRRLLSEQFQLHAYVDMVGTSAFHSANVIAYPAVFIVGRKITGKTRVARRPDINSRCLNEFARRILDHKTPDPAGPIREISRIGPGTQPWILNPSEDLTLVRRLEQDFLPIEDTGCRVGIGVATGADRIFVGPYDALEVEEDRKLPLVMTRDIHTDGVRWQGMGVINPFADSGSLVPLSDFPLLGRYFHEHRDDLTARHIARKVPANWYRTIDRIHPSLAVRPKLLIPDIKGEAQIVYESGCLYPHHNLYYITSSEWELEALRALLLSGIVRLFVSAYSVRMRGGYLRYQAQYLRRIRVPIRSSVPTSMVDLLIEAAANQDADSLYATVAELYRMTPSERALIAPENNLQQPDHA